MKSIWQSADLCFFAIYSVVVAESVKKIYCIRVLRLGVSRDLSGMIQMLYS